MATIEEMYANVTVEEVWRTWQTSARLFFSFSPDAPDYSEDEFEKAVWDTHAMLILHLSEAYREIRDLDWR